MGRAAQVYDLVAGGQGLTMSRYMTPTESRRQFPTLAQSGPSGRELKGTARALAPSAGPAPSPWAIGRALSFDQAKQAPGSGSPPPPPAAAYCRACAHLGYALLRDAAVLKRAPALAMGAAGRARGAQAALLTQGRWQPCSRREAGSLAHARGAGSPCTPLR